METTGHDSVGGVECLLDTVSVVYVDIDVENAGMYTSVSARALLELEDSPEKLKDTQDNIVHIAETGCFGLLCVVQASSPVDGDVCCTRVELFGCGDGSSCRDSAELEHPFECRAVFARET